MQMSELEVEKVVREVTDEEEAHYREFGWVMLRGLVNPAFAREMLRALAEAGDFGGHPARHGVASGQKRAPDIRAHEVPARNF